jgi:hypothetical protein
MLVAFAVTCLALLTFRRFVASRQKDSTLPLPLLCILIFSGLGSCLFFIHAIVSIVIFAGFPYVSIIFTVGGRHIRRISPDLNLAGYMLYGFATCTGVCSLFVLPLTWVRQKTF